MEISLKKKELEEARYIPERIRQLERQIAKIQRKAEEVDGISGKVQSSQKDWPYLPTQVTVQIPKPKQYTDLQRRIIQKEQEKAKLEKQYAKVESFIASVEDVRTRTLLTSLYIENKSQEVAGGLLGISQGRVSQIIEEICDG